MSTLRLDDEHINEALPEILASILDIVGVFNSPERDAAMLESAGLSLERALYPLLVLISKFGPISISDLAERVGRDYSTVSRQTARLEVLLLVSRHKNPSDRRSTEAVVTERGRAAAIAVDGARARLAMEIFRDWEVRDFDELVRLLRTLADGLSANYPPGSALALKQSARISEAQPDTADPS